MELVILAGSIAALSYPVYKHVKDENLNNLEERIQVNPQGAQELIGREIRIVLDRVQENPEARMQRIGEDVHLNNPLQAARELIEREIRMVLDGVQEDPEARMQRIEEFVRRLANMRFPLPRE